jgi:hypothetical protein
MLLLEPVGIATARNIYCWHCGIIPAASPKCSIAEEAYTVDLLGGGLASWANNLWVGLGREKMGSCLIVKYWPLEAGCPQH